jgi:hypothetical protein
VLFNLILYVEEYFYGIGLSVQSLYKPGSTIIYSCVLIATIMTALIGIFDNTCFISVLITVSDLSMFLQYQSADAVSVT